MSHSTLKAPFAWFGGKSQIAPVIWRHLGNPRLYIEPFGGSLAVLLARPECPSHEIVNDANAFIANFWRAMQKAAKEVVQHLTGMARCFEVELHAMNRWLTIHASAGVFRELLMRDPSYFDAKVAAWWVSGQSLWLGDSWCSGRLYRQLPRITHGSRLANASAEEINQWLIDIAARLLRVRVACGDWKRVVSPCVLGSAKKELGIVLDPPYRRGNMKYANAISIDIDELVRWAVDTAKRYSARIVLCGREGDYVLPKQWRVVQWSARGGFDNRSINSGRKMERLWLSPACL